MKKTTKKAAAKAVPSKKPQATERHLRHEFTQAESLENAKQLAEALNKTAQIGRDFDRVKADFKARLSVVEAETGALRDKVSSGYEMRPTKCEWRFDDPKAGRKSLYRLDTDECIEATDMSEADKQIELPIADPAPAGEKPFGVPVAEAFAKATNHGGVVTVEADGDEVTDRDDNRVGD